MKEELYKCQSYYDEENNLQDCSCGGCMMFEEASKKLANAGKTETLDILQVIYKKGYEIGREDLKIEIIADFDKK